MRFGHIISSAFAVIVLSASASYAEVEYARVQSVDKNTIVIQRENGTFFELYLDRTCQNLWRYQGKTIEIEYYGRFMDPGTMVYLPKERERCRVRDHARLEAPRPKPKPAPRFQEESVRVTMVRGNYVTIRRDNGAQYELEIGAGCRDIARYRDRHIRATWTGGFLEYDARLFLPNTDQECRVRSSSRR